jgi:hypothetical protein
MAVLVPGIFQFWSDHGRQDTAMDGFKWILKAVISSNEAVIERAKSDFAD